MLAGRKLRRLCLPNGTATREGPTARPHRTFRWPSWLRCFYRLPEMSRAGEVFDRGGGAFLRGDISTTHIRRGVTRWCSGSGQSGGPQRARPLTTASSTPRPRTITTTTQRSHYSVRTEQQGDVLGDLRRKQEELLDDLLLRLPFLNRRRRPPLRPGIHAGKPALQAQPGLWLNRRRLTVLSVVPVVAETKRCSKSRSTLCTGSPHTLPGVHVVRDLRGRPKHAEKQIRGSNYDNWLPDNQQIL